MQYQLLKLSHGKRKNTSSWNIIINLIISSLIFFEESNETSMPPILTKIIPIYSDLKIDIGKLVSMHEKARLKYLTPIFFQFNPIHQTPKFLVKKYMMKMPNSQCTDIQKIRSFSFIHSRKRVGQSEFPRKRHHVRVFSSTQGIEISCRE